MKRIVVEITCFLYVCLFLYTAISKVAEYDITREKFGMMPLIAPIAYVIVWLLPSIEVILATFIFIPRYRIPGLYGAISLMLLFTAYICYMMIFYKDLPCSCGGLMEQLSWTGHLVFNCAFILLGVSSLGILKSKADMPRQQTKILEY